MNEGTVRQIVGVVVDVDFSGSELPPIYNALELKREDDKRLVLEVQQHLGENMVRTVAMDSTDGLVRGTTVTDTGSPITVPVGEQVLGRLLNVVGDPIDGKDSFPPDAQRLPLHNEAPPHENQVTSDDMLETGIKVVALICPFARGGQLGSVGGAGGVPAVARGVNRAGLRAVTARAYRRDPPVPTGGNRPAYRGNRPAAPGTGRRPAARALGD